MDITQRIVFFIVAIPAIVFHEVAHGWVADKLGDPTARMLGRLSLNPLKHIDPFGTVILPAMLALLGLPVFGYAKPVPIITRNFGNYRWGLLLTGLAGPATNFVLAVGSGLVVRVLAATGTTGTSYGAGLATVLYLFADINLVLMFFNLIPIPPFDGSRVLPVLLSDRAMRVYEQVERYGFVIIFALLYVGRGIIGLYFALTVDPLLRLLTGM